ncbi:MAG TPA: tRNA epoxyqueuosine(34) reductase QueG [Bryobacteraceae bacterium]|nr:tRNA epoxyqueuosine(34) reductase QueG [Bryobacteraceae bacterium]
MTAAEVKRLAHECGFELAGIAPARPNADVPRYLNWVARGAAGAMSYLTDRRAGIRSDPRMLLPSARSIISVGKLYDTPHPRSTEVTDSDLAWISRYAWGSDYHDLMRRRLTTLVQRMSERAEFEWKICIDTAPLLERSYARDAGLGWIGKNTCLINQHAGSFFFLGEVLTSLDLEPDAAVEPRCGTCTRCIDACPTQAIVPGDNGAWELDARLCISYVTIELRGPILPEQRSAIGRHVFGCDICQDVCPWNARAAMTLEPDFAPREIAPPLERLAEITEDQFRTLFRGSPVLRAKYSGFLRNVAIAMGNSGNPKFRHALERLASSPDPLVAEHAAWALTRIERRTIPRQADASAGAG